MARRTLFQSWRFFILAASVLLSAAAGSAQVTQEEERRSLHVPAVEATDEARNAARSIVTLSDGRLTVSLRAATLREVMEAIARQAAIRFHFKGSGADVTVTAAFVGLSLEDGLRRLLRDTNYLIVWSWKGQTKHPARVTVYSATGGAWSPPTDATLSPPGATRGTIDVRIPESGAEDRESSVVAGVRATEGDRTLRGSKASSPNVDLERGASRRGGAPRVSGTRSSSPGTAASIGSQSGELAESFPKKLYWTDAIDATIQRANPDEMDVEDLMISGLGSPRGIAIDSAGGKIYWVDNLTQKVQRSNLDGSEVTDLVTTGLVSPVGLTVDPAGRHVYWVDASTGNVQRIDVDGTGPVEEIVTELDSPVGIALDNVNGKIYWTEEFARRIQRANLNGSGVQELVTGLGSPRGIALDPVGGKMYWVDGGNQKVQRANLDGTGRIDDLVTTGLTSPVGIALDLSAGKMYWADSDEGRIQRANLDGTEIETIFEGLPSPQFVALCEEENLNVDELFNSVCEAERAEFLIEDGEPDTVLKSETVDGTENGRGDEIRIIPENE